MDGRRLPAAAATEAVATVQGSRGGCCGDGSRRREPAARGAAARQNHAVLPTARNASAKLGVGILEPEDLNGCRGGGMSGFMSCRPQFLGRLDSCSAAPPPNSARLRAGPAGLKSRRMCRGWRIGLGLLQQPHQLG